jgi:RNA polymerase sigma-54 factor
MQAAAIRAAQTHQIMKHSLQLRLSQHLTLTPQLQQSIKLLQLSTQELDQEIERYLRDNPLLERGEEYAEPPPAAQPAGVMSREGDYPSQAVSTTGASEGGDGAGDSGDTSSESRERSQDDILSELSYGSTRDRDDRDGRDADDGDFPQVAGEAPTLREHLLSQLALLNLTGRDRTLTGLLIDTLDDSGYLTQSLDEVLAMLPGELAVEPDELVTALRYVQHLEPAGVGARDLAECLRLQLEALPGATPYCDKAIEVVSQYLDVLAGKDYARLKRLLRCDDHALRAVQKLITSLDPRPGRDYASADIRYIIPDVIVNKNKGLWVASLNPEAMPKLRVNRLYADILSRERGTSRQMSGQLQEAKWLIKNVQQRFDTILRVSQAIVDRQRNFLEHGAIAMRPLVLREIADVLELHESTVSRVTTNKFMRTPRGIFELKYFFGSHVSTDAGGVASSTAIREVIRQLVGQENPRKPLSDARISELLGQQGIVVARRTVAKYRESLQILPGNLRKTL